MRFLKETSNSDVLAVRSGLHGCFRVFFLGLGVLLLASLISPPRFAFRDSKGNLAPWYLVVPFGIGLLAAGLYRKEMMIDRAAQRVETTHRCVVPIASNSQSIDPSGHVELRRELRRKGSSSRPRETGVTVSVGDNYVTEYPVRLIGSDLDIQIGDSSLEVEARRDAEQLAQFLSLPLHDSSTGTVAVRQPAELDESVGQRAHRLGVQTKVAAPPELQTRIETSGTDLRLVVPPQGWSAKLAAVYLPLAGFGMFCLWFLWTPPLFIHSSEVGQWVMGIGFTILLGVAPVVLGVGMPVAEARRQVTLDISPATIRTTTNWFWWRHSRTIAAEEIEDVSVSEPSASPSKITAHWERAIHQRQIVFRTDRRTFPFGRHLSAAEQDYLASLIRATLEA